MSRRGQAAVGRRDDQPLVRPGHGALFRPEGVTCSTAHRLLGMLVHQDVAEQLPDVGTGRGR